MHNLVENTRIEKNTQLVDPNELKSRIIANDEIYSFVHNIRKEISDILQDKNKKFIMIIGPCSIHNIEEAKIYGNLLKDLSNRVEDKILIIMRVYFEKPRTTKGWKGLINDPDLNETFNINKGLELSRTLLHYLNEIYLPCACEILEPITPEYLSDLISWSAIGARTTESQIHRQLVSGLSMPVGFKNGTGGSIDIALDAIQSSNNKHCFIGITGKGNPSIFHTKGNTDTHIILRGGKTGPNYYEKNLDDLEEQLELRNIESGYIVDCSHGNSRKNYTNQPKVMDYLLKQKINGRSLLKGIMLESNIYEGKQNLSNNLRYGISITDSCLSFDETKELVLNAYKLL